MRILVGFPAGGPLDIAARIVAPLLSSRLGSAVVVENRPGASGNIATADVVGAAPDGHTLLLCGPVNAINASLFANLAFDFVHDIASVALIASVPLVVEVNPAVPVRSVPELLAFVRRHPGRLRIAFAGAGTPQHIAIEMFRNMAGAEVTLIAYPGSAAALAAILSGDADAMFDPAPSSMPHIRAGRLIPVATTGAVRAAMLPTVPALAEFLAGYQASSWFGLGAPRETPIGIVEQLNGAINDGLSEAATVARFAVLGATIDPCSTAEFARFVVSEAETYRRIIQATGITPA